MAGHYGTAIIPARVRKPKDKAKVEVGVQIVLRFIRAGPRKRNFFSLAEANAAIRERLELLNNRPFRKLPGNPAQSLPGNRLPRIVGASVAALPG